MLDEDKKVDDLNRPLQEFALDAIGVMFIGNKLDVLQGSLFGYILIFLKLILINYVII